MEKNKRKITNADCVSVLAVINLIISIIGAIAMFFTFFEYRTVDKYGKIVLETNWWGVAGAVVVLVIGFTIFFTLITIKDIYYIVRNKN